MSVRQRGYLAPLSNSFLGLHETSTCSRGNTGYLSGTTARHTFLSISPVLIGYCPSSNFCCLLHYRARTSLKALFEPHVKFYFCGNAWEHSYRERYIYPLFQAYTTSCSIHSFERSVHSKCEKFSSARMELQTADGRHVQYSIDVAMSYKRMRKNRSDRRQRWE